MQVLTIILIVISILSLFLSYLSFLSEKTTIQIIKEMGLGYNLGNSFDSYNISKEIKTPEEQIGLMGNPAPTRRIITNIKKYGFKTIRFPVTWINFIDNLGNINSEWMKRVKEVVNWIIEKNIYCILNLYHDGDKGNWLYYGEKAMDKYITLWTQIAEEFKNYNEYLVFESMNEPEFVDENYKLDYALLNNLTQKFVNIIRKSGGMNSKRLLIVTGMKAELYYTSNFFQIPIDPSNKIAISIHYYDPSLFTTTEDDEFSDNNIWGSETDYKIIISNFEILKNEFTDRGIPIIITEIGVKTEEGKELSSIREYLYTVFSLSFDNELIIPCLWDTSNKNYGDMNYYNRENDKWYDEKIQEYFFKFSRERNIKSSNFYKISNKETTYSTSEFGDYMIRLGNKKPLKLILNANYKGELFIDYDFSISSFDINGDFFDIEIEKKNGKKQKDGTIIYTFDISEYDCHDFIEIINWGGEEFYFNNVTIEYNENFMLFDYKSYKYEILNEIK